MGSQTAIRAMYKPLQPTVKQAAMHVSYEEFLPDSQLQDFIYCYWQLKTAQPLAEEFRYRVVADGCIDIFFDCSNAGENYVMGFCKKFTEFPLESSFNYFGIRFLPGMFPQLFKVNAMVLSNRFQLLANVVPDLSGFIAKNIGASDPAVDIVHLFDEYFLNHVAHVEFDWDSRFYDAVHIILSNLGVIDVEHSLHTGISARQLRRLFAYYIGDTAKTFSKVVRFQHILRAKPSNQSLRQNKLFYDVGYYDQAHFIKDFKHFYGVTPGKAFGR